jgi:hypothetical protein
MHQINVFFKLSYDKKSLLLKSVVLAILIRIFLYIIPFSRVYSISNKLARIHINQKTPKQIHDIIWSVRVVANHFPGLTCLIQAITAQMLMTHYNYDSTLRIGVNKSKNFGAHAWLEMDNKIILGESPMDFVPILDLEPKI